MPLKDLLVSFDRTAAGYARLDLAFNLAGASRAHLAGAYVLPETHVSPAGSVEKRSEAGRCCGASSIGPAAIRI